MTSKTKGIMHTFVNSLYFSLLQTQKYHGITVTIIVILLYYYYGFEQVKLCCHNVQSFKCHGPPNMIIPMQGTLILKCKSYIFSII